MTRVRQREPFFEYGNRRLSCGKGKDCYHRNRRCGDVCIYQGFPTSNHYGATADGLVLGYRAGAQLLYQDSIQYHPTGAIYPSQILGRFVTEKVRSVGAQHSLSMQRARRISIRLKPVTSMRPALSVNVRKAAA